MGMSMKAINRQRTSNPKSRSEQKISEIKRQDTAEIHNKILSLTPEDRANRFEKPLMFPPLQKTLQKN